MILFWLSLKMRDVDRPKKKLLCQIYEGMVSNQIDSKVVKGWATVDVNWLKEYSIKYSSHNLLKCEREK